MSTSLAPKPSRAELAEAALRAATELSIILGAKDKPREDYIFQFREALHNSMAGWVNEGGTGRLTDALTARLYFDAMEKTKGRSVKSLEEYLENLTNIVHLFDKFDESVKEPASLREMCEFALALHTLLIGDAYGRLSHWKHKELL